MADFVGFVLDSKARVASTLTFPVDTDVYSGGQFTLTGTYTAGIPASDTFYSMFFDDESDRDTALTELNSGTAPADITVTPDTTDVPTVTLNPSTPGSNSASSASLTATISMPTHAADKEFFGIIGIYDA